MMMMMMNIMMIMMMHPVALERVQSFLGNQWSALRGGSVVEVERPRWSGTILLPASKSELDTHRRVVFSNRIYLRRQHSKGWND